MFLNWANYLFGNLAHWITPGTINKSLICLLSSIRGDSLKQFENWVKYTDMHGKQPYQKIEAHIVFFIFTWFGYYWFCCNYYMP